MDEPDWTRRDGEVLIWQMPGEETVLPKKKPVLKTGVGIMIILAALLTGGAFGILMMSAVPEKPAKQAQAMSATPQQQVPAKAGSEEKEAVPVTKTISLFVIQGGLFSTEAAAEAAASASTEQAAVIPSQNEYSMIYGVFFTKEEADEAEQQMEAGGTAAYVKETKATVSNEEEEALKQETGSQRLKKAATILSP